MKKTLSLLIVFVMVFSCISSMAISSSAAVAYVEETYTYGDAKNDFGIHYTDGAQLDEWQAYLADEFILGGHWTYEYWDPADESFHPMTAYYPENHLEEAWAHWTWQAFYTANSESAWYENEYTYCSIGSSGSSMYPSTGAASVITFIVPATGVISYDASLYCNSKDNTAEVMGEDKYGNYVTLWVNDTQVWPATEEESLIHYDNAPESSPKEISLSAFNVKEGDRVRLRVASRNGNRSNKGTMLKDLPQITYHSAEVPIGNPNGAPPANISAECPKKTLNCIVTWDAAKNAAGYNIYLKPDGAEEYTKYNEEPIAETTYTLENLESATTYEMVLSSVNAEGKESEYSDPQVFKTRKVETETSSQTAVSDTDVADTGSVAATTDAPSNVPADGSAAFPWWVIPAAAAVVVLIAVVVLTILLNKKKKTDVPPEQN